MWRLKLELYPFSNYFKVIQPDSIQQSLNSFHENIQFTYELEQANQISFLDVLTRKEDGSVQTSVYRKPNHTDVYLNWNAHAPNIWKTATEHFLNNRFYRPAPELSF